MGTILKVQLKDITKIDKLKNKKKIINLIL